VSRSIIEGRVVILCRSEVALRLAILTFDPFLNASARKR
jgi:hypothetical protein